jgi:hypothetical protein
MKRIFFIISALILMSVTATYAQPDFIWGKQFGSEQDDKTRNLVADISGNIFIVGKTTGKLGQECYGKSDGFIAKIDSTARLLWIQQIGSKENDELKHADVDMLGNLYAVGYICPDDINRPKDTDIFVVKVDSNGKTIWEKTYGTDAPDTGENIVVANDGTLYLTGSTKGSMSGSTSGKEDCFILHLDTDGKIIHSVQFGTSECDLGAGLTIDEDSKIYVCGATRGNLAAQNAGGDDLFWGIFTRELKQIKLVQSGTNKGDYVGEIRTDKTGDIYISGSTDGDMACPQIGNTDAFLQKWSKKGQIEWTKQFGTGNWDGVHSICVLQNKGVLISGCQNYPKCQSFCKMFDKNGSLLWDRYLIGQGEGGGTCGKDIFIDNKGFLYHAGYTGANLFSDLKGMHDLFLIKLKIDI